MTPDEISAYKVKLSRAETDVDRLRADLRRMEDRATQAEAERDEARAQVDEAYGILTQAIGRTFATLKGAASAAAWRLDCHDEEAPRVAAQMALLTKQVTRARALHRTPEERGTPDHPDCSCGLHSPCPTRRALDDGQGS